MAVATSPARVDGLPALPGVEHHWLDVPSGCGRVRLHVAEAGGGLHEMAAGVRGLPGNRFPA